MYLVIEFENEYPDGDQVELTYDPLYLKVPDNYAESDIQDYVQKQVLLYQIEEAERFGEQNYAWDVNFDWNWFLQTHPARISDIEEQEFVKDFKRSLTVRDFLPLRYVGVMGTCDPEIDMRLVE